MINALLIPLSRFIIPSQGLRNHLEWYLNSHLHSLYCLYFKLYSDSSRCLHLLRQSSVYNLGYKRDPLLSFILFYGIWAILTQTLNLIELWKEELIPLAKNIKWWTIWWLLFMNSGFAYSCAIGEAGNENLINRIDILA